MLEAVLYVLNAVKDRIPCAGCSEGHAAHAEGVRGCIVCIGGRRQRALVLEALKVIRLVLLCM